MPASRALLPLLLALAVPSAGCGNDAKLAELEGKQRDLRTEYDAVAADVEKMRSQLQAMGVLDAEPKAAKAGKGKAGGGKAKGKVGYPTPKNNVTAALGITATRTGTTPGLPALPEIQRGEDTPCGWKFQVKEIQPISDYQVNAAGLGKAGPVMLLEDGKPLASHALPADYEGQCAGAFRHAGFLILFSPQGAPEAVEGKKYSIALSEDVPLARGDDGRPIYWIYPGTTLRIETGKAWDPAWGKLEADLVPHTFGGSTNYQVTIAGTPIDLPDDQDAPHLHHVVDPVPAGPIIVEISSPADGPYVALQTLTLGNADHAAVVTSEVAFRAAAGK